MALTEIHLKYTGEVADAGLLDLYDVGRSLVGLHRTLAVSTHFLLNGEIITKATALEGAEILVPPFEAGSWKTKALVFFTVAAAGTYNLAVQAATASPDTPLGHLATSFYDWVIRRTTGQPLNYEETLFETIEKAKEEGTIPASVTPERFDSVAEKCESAIKDIHRPMIDSETALQCELMYSHFKFNTILNADSYYYIADKRVDNDIQNIIGSVSSFNMNTYRGRLYVSELQRTITFEVPKDSQSPDMRSAIISSLAANDENRRIGRGDVPTIEMSGFLVRTRTGMLKAIYVRSARRL